MQGRRLREIEKRDKGIMRHDLKAEELYCFHDFPIYMGVSDESEDTDLYADLKFSIDRLTGIIFINELIPENILYQKAHYNNVGKGWMEHHEAFAKFMMKYRFSNVFEIGGGTGLLSKCCYHNGSSAQWTILDPVPNPVEGCPATYVRGFFEDGYKISPETDAVVHTHTLEHFYNPQEFLKAIGRAMKNGTWMFMSIPNMEEMYKRHYTNVLNFEHTYYCAEPYVSCMLALSGYEVVERQLFKPDHSIFYAAHKTGNSKEISDFSGCYDRNKTLFRDWVKFHEELIEKCNKELECLAPKQTVYLFGAHVFSQFLTGFGMNMERVGGGAG